jgi:hypothetical protein
MKHVILWFMGERSEISNFLMKDLTEILGLAKVAVQCSADTFLVNQSLVLRINFCGENSHLLQDRNRYRYVY